MIEINPTPDSVYMIFVNWDFSTHHIEIEPCAFATKVQSSCVTKIYRLIKELNASAEWCSSNDVLYIYHLLHNKS